MNAYRNMILVIGAWLSITATIGVFGSDAMAQQICLVRDDAIEQLKKKFGEDVSGRGITGNGQAMIEVLTSEKGTWTVVVTDVNGRACVIATGEAWQKLQPLYGRPS